MAISSGLRTSRMTGSRPAIEQGLELERRDLVVASVAAGVGGSRPRERRRTPGSRSARGSSAFGPQIGHLGFLRTFISRKVMSSAS